MKLMANGASHFAEVAYALIEWLSYKSGVPGSLAIRNNQGQSALYMACLSRTKQEDAVVVRYLADTLYSLNYNIAEVCTQFIYLYYV